MGSGVLGGMKRCWDCVVMKAAQHNVLKLPSVPFIRLKSEEK